MSFRKAIGLLLGLAFATPAVPCEPERQIIMGFVAQAGIPFEARGGLRATSEGCVWSDLSLQTSPSLEITAKRLIWDVIGLDAVLLGELDPVEFRLDLHDVMTLPRTQDPVMNYLLALKQRENFYGFSVQLTYHPDQQLLHIDRLDVDFPGQSRIKVTGSIWVIG